MARLGALERSSALVLAATVIGNGGSYGYHVLLSRHLGPSSYGLLGALLGAALIVSIPASGIQYTVARRVAAAATDTSAVAGALGLAIKVSLVLGGALLVAIPVLRQFLDVPTGPLVMMVAWVPALALTPVALGYVQGGRRFGVMAASVAVLGLGRVGGAVVAVVLGTGVTGGVLILVASAYLSLAVAVVAGRLPLHISRAGATLVEAGWAALPFAVVGAVAGLDVVLARHYLPARSAGYYVAAAVAGKIVLWAPAAVGLVAFPEFAGHRAGATATLRRALTLVAAICAAALAVTLVFQRQVIGLLFGDRFLPAADVIVIVSSAMTLLALVQVVAMWAVARSDRTVGLLASVGVPALVGSVALYHGSTRVVALDVFGSVALTAVAVGIGARRLAARTDE